MMDKINSPKNPSRLVRQTAGFFCLCLMIFTAGELRGAEATGAGLSHELERMLDNVREKNVPGEIKGVLVPSRVDPHGLQIAAFGYNVIKRGDFRTVIFFYTAPALEEEGVIMPESDAIDTPFGSLKVDTALRQALLAGTTQFRMSDSAHRWSETVTAHMNFLHKVVRRRKVRVLPLAIAVADWDKAKSVPVAVLRALDSVERDRHDVLVMIAANLSRGFERQQAVYHDSRSLAFLENLSAGDLLRYIEDNAIERANVPDTGPIVAGVLTVNQLLANRGDALMYGNSGQFPVARKEDSLRSTGMASIVFNYGKKRAVQFSKDRTKKIAKRVSERLLANLVRQARIAIGQALDPSSETLRASDDKAAQAKLPVFVSLFKEGRLLGQSGSIEAQGPLEEAVRFHSVQAALHDPDVPPLKKQDFDTVIIGVDIPSQPQSITPDEIVPGLDGLVLDCENRRNIFLPVEWKRFPHRSVFAAELAAQIGLDPWRWKSRGADLAAFQVLSVREGEGKEKEEQQRLQKEKGAEPEEETDFYFK